MLNIVVSPYLYVKVRAVLFSNNIVNIFIQEVCIANNEWLFNVLIFFCHNEWVVLKEYHQHIEIRFFVIVLFANYVSSFTTPMIAALIQWEMIKITKWCKRWSSKIAKINDWLLHNDVLIFALDVWSLYNINFILSTCSQDWVVMIDQEIWLPK